ncbi:MAG: hypothetical protein H6767_09940 [Candidatus Peribacteria bacterium]|nr:MAG: hypothetical protein H6767_09940 [Candidatus Peribacteria bacterium]
MDGAGKEYGLEVGTTIQVDKDTAKNQNEGVWTIQAIIGNKSIVLSNGETLDMYSFYHAFQSKKAKRIAKV